jgi:hypothetical protein
VCGHQNRAPYSDVDEEGEGGRARTFSRGIWKNVYLITVSTTSITSLVPHVFYTGAFPTEPLREGAFEPFKVQVRVHFWRYTIITDLLSSLLYLLRLWVPYCVTVQHQ